MLWVCEQCNTVHTQNPTACRNCDHRIFESMPPEEYERRYDEDRPESVEPITFGTTPDPDFDSSPDVAADGSIKRPRGDDQKKSGDTPSGLLARIWNWLF